MDTKEWAAYDERAEILSKLEDGWYWENDGKAMNLEAMVILRNTVKKLEEASPKMPSMFPFPGLEGEIIASWMDENSTGSIIVSPDLTIEAYIIHIASNQYCGVEDKSQDEAVSVLAGWFDNIDGINWDKD